MGDSAIDPMIDVLYDLKKESWPTTEEYGNTDLNIGLLNGGQAANALAEQSSAMLMFRLVTDPDVIYKRVEVGVWRGQPAGFHLSTNWRFCGCRKSWPDAWA